MRLRILAAIGLIALFPIQAHAQLIDHRNWLPGTNITFAGNSVRLSKLARSTLNTIAERMKVMPTFKVAVEGGAINGKPERLRNQRRVDAAVDYLVESCNIDRMRFVMRYEGSAKVDKVMFREPHAGDFD